MTLDLPGHLRARHVAQAFAEYLAAYKAAYMLVLESPEDFTKLDSRKETAERELIQTLAAIWQESTHRSPRSRVPDKDHPYGWTYPFAKWVADLFPDYTDMLPTPPGRIRRILRRETAVNRIALKA
jgi:hypothetical protein